MQAHKTFKEALKYCIFANEQIIILKKMIHREQAVPEMNSS